MKMKKLKTGTAMALTLVMMGAPMIKASASEVEKSGVSYEEKLEYVNIEQPFGHWCDCGVRLAGKATKSFTVMFCVSVSSSKRILYHRFP